MNHKTHYYKDCFSTCPNQKRQLVCSIPQWIRVQTVSADRELIHSASPFSCATCFRLCRLLLEVILFKALTAQVGKVPFNQKVSLEFLECQRQVQTGCAFCPNSRYLSDVHHVCCAVPSPLGSDSALLELRVLLREAAPTQESVGHTRKVNARTGATHRASALGFQEGPITVNHRKSKAF